MNKRQKIMDQYWATHKVCTIQDKFANADLGKIAPDIIRNILSQNFYSSSDIRAVLCLINRLIDSSSVSDNVRKFVKNMSIIDASSKNGFAFFA